MVPMTERAENLPSVNVHQMMGPATPMTPMTPGSADPGILPQLQYVSLSLQIFPPFQCTQKAHVLKFTILQKYCVHREFELQTGSEENCTARSKC